MHALRLLTVVVRWNLHQLALDSKRRVIDLDQPASDLFEMVRNWLPGILEECCRLQPGATFELVAADRAEDLLGDQPPATLSLSVGSVPYTPGMCDPEHDLRWRDAFRQVRSQLQHHPIASRDPKYATSLLLSAAALSVQYSIANPTGKAMVVAVPNHMVSDPAVDEASALWFSNAMAPQNLVDCPAYKLALRLAADQANTRLKELAAVLARPRRAPKVDRTDFKYLLFFFQGQRKTSRDTGPDAATKYCRRLLGLMAGLGYRNEHTAWAVLRAAGIHDQMDRNAVYELTNHGQVRFLTYLCLALRGLGLLNVRLFQSIVPDAEHFSVARRLHAFGMSFDEVAVACGVQLPARYREPS